MKKLVVSALVLVSSLAALSGLSMIALAQQPPLVDRDLFFGEVQISGAQISPDGQWLSFLKPYKGTRNIWVKKASEPFSAARPMSGYFWSRDAKYILYSQDNAGDENFNVYAIDPKAAADPATGMPTTRALTNLKKVRTEVFAAPKSKPDVL